MLLRLLAIRSRRRPICLRSAVPASHLLGLLALAVLHRLLVRNRQGVDTEEVADCASHQECPPKVRNRGKHEIAVQISQLHLGCDSWETKPGQVAQDGAPDKREEHDGPVGKGLAREMGEDHLGGHAAKDKAHSQTEQHQVVFLAERRKGAVQPKANGEEVDGKGSPLEKDWRNGQILPPARLHNMLDAARNVEEQADDDGHWPDVAYGQVAQLLCVAKCVLFAQHLHDRRLPNLRTAEARNSHDGSGNEQTLGGAIDVAQVESMRVVCLPGRKEHGNARAQGGENTSLGAAESHGGRLEKGRKCTVERIDAVVEQLAESARGAGAAGLLAIDIVHGLVHEEAECETKIYP